MNWLEKRLAAKVRSMPAGPFAGIDAVLADELDGAFRVSGEDGEVLSNRLGALSALHSENAFFYYLQACAWARTGRVGDAKAFILEGNLRPSCWIPCRDVPTIGVSLNISLLQELRNHADVLVSDTTTGASAMRRCAVRIARAEPQCKLFLLYGAALMHAFLQSQLDLALKSPGRADLPSSESARARHRAWCWRTFREARRSQILGWFTKWHFRAMSGATDADLLAIAKGEPVDPERSEAIARVAGLLYRLERHEIAPIQRLIPPDLEA